MENLRINQQKKINLNNDLFLYLVFIKLKSLNTPSLIEKFFKRFVKPCVSLEDTIKSLKIISKRIKNNVCLQLKFTNGKEKDFWKKVNEVSSLKKLNNSSKCVQELLKFIDIKINSDNFLYLGNLEHPWFSKQKKQSKNQNWANYEILDIFVKKILCKNSFFLLWNNTKKQYEMIIKDENKIFFIKIRQHQLIGYTLQDIYDFSNDEYYIYWDTQQQKTQQQKNTQQQLAYSLSNTKLDFWKFVNDCKKLKKSKEKLRQREDIIETQILMYIRVMESLKSINSFDKFLKYLNGETYEIRRNQVVKVPCDVAYLKDLNIVLRLKKYNLDIKPFFQKIKEKYSSLIYQKLASDFIHTQIIIHDNILFPIPDESDFSYIQTYMEFLYLKYKYFFKPFDLNPNFDSDTKIWNVFGGNVSYKETINKYLIIQIKNLLKTIKICNLEQIITIPTYSIESVFNQYQICGFNIYNGAKLVTDSKKFESISDKDRKELRNYWDDIFTEKFTTISHQMFENIKTFVGENKLVLLGKFLKYITRKKLNENFIQEVKQYSIDAKQEQQRKVKEAKLEEQRIETQTDKRVLLYYKRLGQRIVKQLKPSKTKRTKNSKTSKTKRTKNSKTSKTKRTKNSKTSKTKTKN
jgi:hypothetical protein